MLVLQKLSAAPTERDCSKSLHDEAFPFWTFSSLTFSAKAFMRTGRGKKKSLAYYIEYPTNTRGKTHPRTVSSDFRAWVLPRRAGSLLFQGLWEPTSKPCLQMH